MSQQRLFFGLGRTNRRDQIPSETEASRRGNPSRERVPSPTASIVATATYTSDSSQTFCDASQPGSLDMESSFDVPDSTDWIETSLPSFEPLGAALRCEVCKDFYDTPMITGCSHTFCSICIRRCITADGKCPSCRKDAQADKLKHNYAVREIVNRFKEARPRALELARTDKKAVDESNRSKKRKLDKTDLTDGEPVRQTRSRAAKNARSQSHGVQASPIEVPDSEDEGEDEFIPDGMVACPICKAHMKEEQVYLHLDVCPGEHNNSSRTPRSRYETIAQPT